MYVRHSHAGVATNEVEPSDLIFRAAVFIYTCIHVIMLILLPYLEQQGGLSHQSRRF